MFEQVREMIDSTIYTNGKGEVTAQNVNLAFHGVLDATEEQVGEVKGSVEQTNNKVTALDNKIEEMAESGLGGLVFKVPMVIMGMLEAINNNEKVFDREAASTILTEYPFLAEPIENLFEHNAKAFQKYKEAVDKGEDAPIITLDYNALYNEMLEAEGVNYSYNVVCVPQLTEAITDGSMGYIVCMFELYDEPTQIAFIPDGSVGIMADSSISTTVSIPEPGADAIDNSDSLVGLDIDSLSANLNNTYQYTIRESGDNTVIQLVTPTHIRATKTNLFFQFLVGNNIVESYVNMNTGMTKSRLIGTTNAIEVEEVPEGRFISTIDSVGADEYTTTVDTESTVDWIVLLDSAEINRGAAGTVTTTVNISANTTSSEIIHTMELTTSPTDGSQPEVLDMFTFIQEAYESGDENLNDDTLKQTNTETQTE